MRWALRERYRSLEREQRIGLLVLALVLLLGAALRLAFMVAYRPALVGYPDSGVYVTGARGTAGLFWDPLRVVGYSVFLRAVHAIDGHLSFTTLVQHGLGLATASLLWLAVRRIAGPAWLAVVPAAFVALGGDQLFLEHSVLSEALFAFLVASGLYAAVRSLDGPRIAWPAASALLFGLSATVRLAGIALVPALAIWLVAVSPAPLRERAARAAVAVAAGGLIVFGYLAAAADQTGHWSFARHGSYALYGRAAGFADCSRFTPPRGTEVLCERTPRSRRPGSQWYIFDPRSPAVRSFGEPQVGSPTRQALSRVGNFARTAILHQPLDYLAAVGGDLLRYVWPSWFARPHPNPGPADYRHLLVDRGWIARVLPNVAAYYGASGVTVKRGLFRRLGDYERVTRVEGPLMALLLLLAALAPLACRGRARAGAALLAIVAFAMLVVPVATIGYDGRFGVPAYGVLAAAAVLGLQGLVSRRGAGGSALTPGAADG